MRRLVAIATVLLGAVLVPTMSSGRAFAAGDDPTQTVPTPRGEIVNNTPEAIVVSSPGGPTQEIHHRGPNRHGRWECHYYLVGGDDRGFEPTPLISQGPIDPVPHTPVALRCLDENGATAYLQIFVFDPAEPLGLLDVAGRAADEALKDLLIAAPALRLSPPVGATQLVGVPTWLWVDDPWTPRQASATLDGVTATVTATPTSVIWDLGEGDTVTCPGPGTAVRPGALPRRPAHELLVHLPTRRPALGDGHRHVRHRLDGDHR